MEVVSIELHNLPLNAVIFIKANFRHRNLAKAAVVPSHSQLHLGGPDGILEFQNIVIAIIASLLQKGRIFRRLLGTVFIPVLDGKIHIISQIQRLRKGNHPQIIDIVQLCGNPLISSRIGPAVIPVLSLHIGRIIVVKKSQGAVLLRIQRAVYHKAASAYGRRLHMAAEHTASVGGIDQAVGRKLCVNQAAYGFIGSSLGLGAFSHLIDCRHIYKVPGIVL